MKRVLFIILFFVGLSLNSYAQFIDNFAVTAAINQSIVFSDNRVTVREPLTGWEAGILGEKQVAKSVKLSTGLTISRIRFGMNDIGGSHVTYLSFPLNVKALLPFNLYTKAGLKLDLKTGSHDAMIPVIINGRPGFMGEGFASAADSNVPGWSVGAGKEFNFGGFKPWVELRYTQDFTSFSGYDGVINMNKRTRKVSIGIPLWSRQ